MRVQLLKKHKNQYSCNSYLIRGEFNAISDVNTLIDIGTADYILDEIKSISTGVGKPRIQQVILTHEHFDHKGGLSYIIKEYSPKVIAHAKFDGVTHRAVDGMKIRIGDRIATILYTPGHSNDSICIYCPEDQALFIGDTPVVIQTSGARYTREYYNIIKKLASLDVKTIYSGHDDPIVTNANKIISNSLENMNDSEIVD